MTGILLAILYTAFFIFLIRKLSFFRVNGMPPNSMVFVFLLKILAGTALWFVYSRLYTDRSTADIFKYFDDGKAIYKLLFEDPSAYFKIILGIPDPDLDRYLDHTTRHWNMSYVQGLYNETRTIIRFNALLDIFSFGNYHVHTVFICFLSLAGLNGIYRSFLPFLQEVKRILFACVFLLPSVLFWGSGVLKEGLILFSMGLLVYQFFQFIKEGITIKRTVLLLVFSFLLALSKLYMLFILIPAFAAHVWIVKTNFKMPLLKYTSVFAGLFLIVLLVPKFNLPFKLMDKQRQSIYMASGGAFLGDLNNKFIYIRPEVKDRVIRSKERPDYGKIVHGVPYVSWYFDDYTDSTYVPASTDTATYLIYYDLERAGSMIDIPLVYPSYPSLLRNSPVALLNSAFRPHLLEAKNPLMILSAIESICIMAFLIVCLLFFSKKFSQNHLVYFCLTVTALLFILIGLTTPVLGSIVRYKVPVLPFFLIAFLFIPDKEKLAAKLPFLRKIPG